MAWQNPVKVAFVAASIVFGLGLVLGVVVVASIPPSVCIVPYNGSCLGSVPNPAVAQAESNMGLLLWGATAAAFIIAYLWERENNEHVRSVSTEIAALRERIHEEREKMQDAQAQPSETPTE